MIWAILVDGIVINRIIADKKFIEENKLDAIEITDLNVDIGAIYDGKDFTNPEQLEIPRETLDQFSCP